MRECMCSAQRQSPGSFNKLNAQTNSTHKPLEGCDGMLPSLFAHRRSIAEAAQQRTNELSQAPGRCDQEVRHLQWPELDVDPILRVIITDLVVALKPSVNPNDDHAVVFKIHRGLPVPQELRQCSHRLRPRSQCTITHGRDILVAAVAGDVKPAADQVRREAVEERGLDQRVTQLSTTLPRNIASVRIHIYPLCGRLALPKNSGSHCLQLLQHRWHSRRLAEKQEGCNAAVNF
mmetsp:Transcript_2463/g.5815  ORF Transcript_2463/g.5815 Transcript_2463/m.5815 type:complete len:233 (-) Transcript_2463:1059-1757(-)